MIHRGRRWIMRFDLSDDEWALLEPLMPKSRMSARVDDRKIMNAIFYVLRTGMPWRDLPERYGPYTTAYNRFNRWSRRGIWKRIFDTLASKSRDSPYLIDSTIMKAYCPKRFYRRHHKIENYFYRIRDWRRIAAHYDKLARNFLVAAALAGALYWIKLSVQTLILSLRTEA